MMLLGFFDGGCGHSGPLHPHSLPLTVLCSTSLPASPFSPYLSFTHTHTPLCPVNVVAAWLRQKGAGEYLSQGISPPPGPALDSPHLLCSSLCLSLLSRSFIPSTNIALSLSHSLHPDAVPGCFSLSLRLGMHHDMAD